MLYSSLHTKLNFNFQKPFEVPERYYIGDGYKIEHKLLKYSLFLRERVTGSRN